MEAPEQRTSSEFAFMVETHVLSRSQLDPLTEDEYALIEQYALAELGARQCAEHIIRLRNESTD